MEHQLLQKVRGLLRQNWVTKVLDTLSYIKYCVIAFAMLIFAALMFIPFCILAIGLSSYYAVDKTVGIP